MPEFIANFELTPWWALAIKLVVILSVVPVLALAGGYAMHKELAHLQHRLGPMYPGGFHGWAQTLADGIKFVLKEDIIPKAADKPVFSIAPAIIFVPVLMLYLVIPVDRSLIVEDLDVGIFYLLAIGSIGTIGTLVAGWASANKYALIGSLRAAAQLIAYELPIVLIAAVIAMLAGTLSVVGIVEAQDWPFIVWPPGIGLIAFFIFLTGVFAEMSHIVVFGALAATLFLGGYRPIVPWEPLEVIPGILWFFVKTVFMIFLIFWIRFTFPRLREDQLQKFAWKYLIPASLGLILVTGAWILYAPDALWR